MGDQVDSVLTITKIATMDRLKDDSVMSKFNEYFKVRQNVILERAKFSQHNQLAGESVEQYIIVLYTLIEMCEYGNLTEELLRDQLVVGIRDSSLLECLQMDPQLTLVKAKRIAHQRKAVTDHHQQLSGAMGDQITIDYIKKAGETTCRQSGSGSNKETVEKPCKCCGKDHKPTDKCPARNATCFKCNHKGHFSTQCLSKTATTSELTVETFLGVVSSNEESWVCSLKLANREMSFKLNTGVEMTEISERAFKELQNITLQSPSKILCGPTHKALKMLGQFDRTFQLDQKESLQTVFVVQGLKANLLGLPAIKSLQLLQPVDTIYFRTEYSATISKTFL